MEKLFKKAVLTGTLALGMMGLKAGDGKTPEQQADSLAGSTSTETTIMNEQASSLMADRDELMAKKDKTADDEAAIIEINRLLKLANYEDGLSDAESMASNNPQ